MNNLTIFVLFIVSILYLSSGLQEAPPVQLDFHVGSKAVSVQAKTNLSGADVVGKWSTKNHFGLDVTFPLFGPGPHLVKVSFTIDDLDNLFVKNGDRMVEGELIAIKVSNAREKIAALTERIAEIEDPVIKEELVSRLHQLKEENEVYAKITGVVRSIKLEVVSNFIEVTLEVEPANWPR